MQDEDVLKKGGSLIDNEEGYQLTNSGSYVLSMCVCCSIRSQHVDIYCCTERRSTPQYGGDLVTLHNVVMLGNVMSAINNK